MPDPFPFQQLEPAGLSRLRREPASREVAAQAEAMIAAARMEAERMFQEARELGLREGYEAGLASAAQELRPAAEALHQASDEVRASAIGRAEALEHEAVAFGLQVADKVLAGALRAQPERVVDVVRGGLRCLVERERVLVRVNPADMGMVRSAVDELRATLGGIEHLEVQEERRVHRGGAIVRSASGEVDARLETKLQRVSEVIEQELGRGALPVAPELREPDADAGDVVDAEPIGPDEPHDA